jgi:hypothetical protein
MPPKQNQTGSPSRTTNHTNHTQQQTQTRTTPRHDGPMNKEKEAQPDNDTSDNTDEENSRQEYAKQIGEPWR